MTPNLYPGAPLPSKAVGRKTLCQALARETFSQEAKQKKEG